MAVTTLMALPSALIPPLLQMGDGHMDMDGWGWAGWLGMSVMMVLVWGSVIALGVLLVRALSGRSGPSGPSSLDIARGRYARGEISEEEFRRIRQELAR